MSSEWQRTTVGEVCTKVFSGGTPTSTNSAYYDGGTIPWLRTKEVNYNRIYHTEQHITQLGFENSSVKLVPVHSVIVAMYGNGDTAGRVAINKTPLTTNQACCNLVIDESQADHRFIYYFLTGQYETLVDLKNGGAQQNLNGQLIKGFPIALPCIAEQREIARLLESLDDRIALLRETNATLEAMAQALFKSWFVDFDLVRAKHEGRAPEAMSDPTAALFPNEFEESELGLVPKGWQVKYVYDAARVIYGAPFASNQFNTNQNGRPLVRIRDLRDEVPGVFTPEEHPKGYLIQPGDLVVGMDGEFRAYLWGGEPGWLNQRVCVFAPVSGVPAAFVHRSIEVAPVV